MKLIEKKDIIHSMSKNNIPERCGQDGGLVIL